MWFIKPMNSLACWIIREIPKDQYILRPTYIKEEVLGTPALALSDLVKEMQDMTQKTKDNLELSFDDLIHRRMSNKDTIFREKGKIDFLHQTITQYLVKLSKEKSLSAADQKRIGEYYRFATDIKRMAGHSIFMSNNTFKMKENSLKFPPHVEQELTDVYEGIMDLFRMMQDGHDKCMKEFAKLGSDLKKRCDKFSDCYLDLLATETFDVEVGDLYYATMISFRSIASYLTGIAVTLGTENTPAPKGKE